jgi:DNA-binding LacI/PurR family transcriptional regulator
VEQAIAELNYVPNRAARALVTQRTDSVALIVSESEARLFGEPFFAGIIRGISAVLAETPLQLWLAMAQSPAERDRVNQHLTSQHVDGVLLLSLHDDDPLPYLLADRGLPAVLGGRSARMLRGAGEPINFVDVDNAGGARLAVGHLVAGGRRLVATIAGPQDMAAGVSRLDGYCQAVTEAHLTSSHDLIAYGDFSEESGAAAMGELLRRQPDLDGIFAASDLMAAGAMRVLKERGRRIPSDVAVVGFEDSVVARQTEPPLTTVHQPVEEMGREMARLLIERIRSDDETGEHAVMLETHLVRRASA